MQGDGSFAPLTPAMLQIEHAPAPEPEKPQSEKPAPEEPAVVERDDNVRVLSEGLKARRALRMRDE